MIRSKNWRVAKLVKDITKKNFLSDGIKNLWNAGTDALKLRGMALKSDISFFSVYLNKCAFFY
jgi:hypothetical protein